MSENARLLVTVDNLLEHIKCVESDVSALSKDMVLIISQFLEKNRLSVSEDVLEVLQFQDIISQQLKASCEAIENVQTYIKMHTKSMQEDTKMISENVEKLIEKLDNSIMEAKNKKSAFQGKAGDGTSEVEFF